MVSQANLQTLAQGGGKYLLAMAMRRGDEVTEAVLSRPGRYRQVAENLEVKEVIVGDGERRRRYAVCFNPIEAKRQKAPHIVMFVMAQFMRHDRLHLRAREVLDKSVA